MSKQTEKAVLWGIIALSVILAVIFALRVPLTDGSNPDETSHMAYIRLLLETHGPVTFTAGDPAYFETHQPPLYYLLCLLPYALTGGNLFAVRLVATLIQIATIFLAYRAGKDLFPSRPEIGLGVAAFIAFLPTQVQLSGAVNNDGLTTLWCLALFWRMGLLVRDGTGSDLRGAALVGLLLGAGLWTKLTIIQLIPTLCIAAFMSTFTGGKTDFITKLRWLAVAIGLGLLIASPWLIRNTILYGDPLNIKIFPLTAGEHTPTPQTFLNAPRNPWTWADYIRTDALRSYASFWFIVPPMVLLPVVGPQLFSFLFVILLGLGGLVGAMRPATQGGVSGNERRVLMLMLIGLCLIVPFFVRFNLQFFQAQGRYFLPALLPAGLLCVVGWNTVLHRGRPMVGALLPGAVLLIVNLLQITMY